MKYNSIIALSLLLGVNAIKIHQNNEQDKSEDIAEPQESDLDSLMDKYDDAEKVKDKPKPEPKKVDANG